MMPIHDRYSDQKVAPMLLGSLDQVWARIRQRLAGLAQEEYLWEPVPDCWSVRPAADGAWEVDEVRTDPEPAPVTTIAWRLWHIASGCLASYTANGLGDWPLRVQGRGWYDEVGPALEAVEQAWSAFRAGLMRLGEDGLWQLLGESWGPYGDDPWVALVLHAQDELSHHGAEVALLRDLYRQQA